jgi:phosphomannomutase
MFAVLRDLRKKISIGFVGGSDLVKISEQLAVTGTNSKRILFTPRRHGCSVDVAVVDEFDYAFAENGLTAYRMGKPLASQSFIKHVGEERYKVLVNFILHYIADMDVPIKRQVALFLIFWYGLFIVIATEEHLWSSEMA